MQNSSGNIIFKLMDNGFNLDNITLHYMV